MAAMQDIWTIDFNALFTSYKNFFIWHKQGEGAYGGLVFGRPSKKEIVQVLFLTAEGLNAATAEFVTSSLSADLELVGNLTIDGLTTPHIGKGFTLTTTQEVLEKCNVTGFLDQNGMLNATQLNNEGLSVWCKVGFECNVRVGRETDDLKNAAERYMNDMDRVVLINQDKGIVLKRRPDKEKVANVLDEHVKGAVQYKDSMEFSALVSLTTPNKEDSEDQKMVPIVRITKDETKYTQISSIFTVVVPSFRGDDSNTLYDRFQEGLRRRVQNMVYVMINGLKKQKSAVPSSSAVFMPPGWTTLIHLQLPQWSDAEQKAYRIRLHRLLNLPSSCPCLRVAQQIPFGGAAASRLLRSPHTSITNFKPNGRVSTVKGPYNYHHYMQDNFDDNGWGCAYRSMQTIWSWFVLNGFTDKPVPSHREIQQCLVNIGDKEEKFVGSRQWIGSTEIGFVLDTLLGVESKFIITNSGAEVPEKARELALHFDTSGSPVMIGGAQLAHTILGVDFDESSGECRFLVLDPHYTGSEDIRTVTGKGWCAWKPASFWKPEFFYNMVLPQPPADAI